MPDETSPLLRRPADTNGHPEASASNSASSSGYGYGYGNGNGYPNGSGNGTGTGNGHSNAYGSTTAPMDKRMLLATPACGLSTVEASRRLQLYGVNELVTSTPSPLRQLLQQFLHPRALLLWLAMALQVARVRVPAVGVLLALQIVGALAAWVDRQRLANARTALQHALKPEALVVRDGVHQTINAALLVPGDRITLTAGCAVPADCELCDAHGHDHELATTTTAQRASVSSSHSHSGSVDSNHGSQGRASGSSTGLLYVDQTLLTGESFPVALTVGDSAKLGALVVRGEADAVVTATGARAFYAATAAAIAGGPGQDPAQAHGASSSPSQAHASGTSSNRNHNNQGVTRMQRVTVRVTVYVLVVALVLAGVCLGALLYQEEAFLPALAFTIVLLLVTVPTELPVVGAAMLAMGSRRLADDRAIVTQLDAIERLAAMDVICADRTGTLTRNKMELQDELPIFYPTASREDVLVTAALASPWRDPPRDAVDTLVLNAIDLRPLEQYVCVSHRAFEPSRKRTQSTIRGPTGRVFQVTKGAPEAVLALAHNVDELREAVEAKVLDLARRGIRSLAVARTEEVAVEGQDAGGHGNDQTGGRTWLFLGLITFLDPPRHDTKRMIDRAQHAGVTVKLLTGDHAAIAVETCRQLGMGTTILGADAFPASMHGTVNGTISMNVTASSPLAAADYGPIVESADGFAHVFPEHKALLVEILRQRGWCCGVTGGGVCDAAALKKAHVGIAVAGATDAARAAADVVLTKPGLAVIVNAVHVARTIVQRMSHYVVHQLAFSVHLLLFLAVSVLLINPGSCRFAHFAPRIGDCPGAALDIPEDGGDDLGLGLDGGDEELGSAITRDERVTSFFRVPVLALALIALMRHATMGSLVQDAQTASHSPMRWDVARISATAIASGATAAVGSLLLLCSCLNSWATSSVLRAHGLGQLSYEQIMMALFLEIALASMLAALSARTAGLMVTTTPPIRMVLPIALGALAATAVAVAYPLPEMQAISIRLSVFLWVYALVWLLVRDAVKVATLSAMDMLAARGLATKDDGSRRPYQRHEAQRQNRIRLGSTYSSSESSLRDSFVAGRAVRSPMDEPMGNLENALLRLNQLEVEVKSIRHNIQTVKGGPATPPSAAFRP